ncbi:GNAT family N-acetyltransferase [Candidatus Pelagibacter bacterium]|nr:GNAT family N-acetyltransferase [Candidatus Pelagibacter bacterium]
MLKKKLVFKEYNQKSPLKGKIDVISKLFCLATPEYCKLFKSLGGNKNTFIKSIINKKNTELEKFVVLKMGSKIIGFYVAYPSNEITQRQMLTNLKMRNSINLNSRHLFHNKILKHINKLPSFSHKGLYLSRNAIIPKYQNKGMGVKLINNCLKKGRKLRKVFLYVRTNNKNAIRFYKNMKFIKESKKNCYYILGKKL